MIIADTGFWLALLDQRDRYHVAAKHALQQYDEDLITTWCVVTETCYFLLNRKGVSTQAAFINSINQGLFEIFNLEVHHAPRIAELMEKYADLPMDLADASLVILAEHLGHGRILSVDQRDFNTYRWKQHYPFENLLVFYSPLQCILTCLGLPIYVAAGYDRSASDVRPDRQTIGEDRAWSLGEEILK